MLHLAIEAVLQKWRAVGEGIAFNSPLLPVCLLLVPSPPPQVTVSPHTGKGLEK